MYRTHHSKADSTGLNEFSWMDVGPWKRGGQIMSFPDYLYGMVLEAEQRDASDLVIELRTIDGAVEVRLGEDTDFIDCHPVDIAVGKRMVIATGTDQEHVTARKVIIFSDN